MTARRKSLTRSTSGAVAPTVALSLFGLIAAGGLAFDYARLASMDSELQSAADQAALAAATQLDGAGTAITRATSAAQTLIVNKTLFANDGSNSGRSVTVPTLIFYSAYNQDTDTGTTTTSPAAAKFVQVSVAPREAFFALTPVVQMFRSGQINASAVAGIGQAICKVPPVMICNPQEPCNNTTDPNYPFDANALVGKGLKLLTTGSGGPSECTGGSAWAPGNFGFLDTHSGETNPVLALKQAIGWNTPPGDCLPISGVDTQTGQVTPVRDAINTRFDIFDNGGPGGGACPSGGACQPSINSVKDLVRNSNANGQNSCGLGPNGWGEAASPYLPSSGTTQLTTAEIAATQTMGHPRDMCHAVSSSGTCAEGRIGDGNWDRNAYFAINYPGLNWQGEMTSAYGSTVVTRYQVYLWEIAHAGDVFTSPTGARTVGQSRVATGTKIDHNQPICGTGLQPSPTTVDRRRLSVAVVNCRANNVGGNSSGVPVRSWVDAFIVEPSANRTRTAQQDVYIEVIGETSVNTLGSTAGQVVQRQVPYLIR
ncbi:pilus assembly protein TadG-related protein [Sphingobium vermicomposti]|uniref:Flp pilus assembly protein TadG n=1 Tax=Sphingobium vermicomposti TaxID=529005 RepID=A0A846M4V9_9SPHN|nr:pilus assembly protein TadG-related protein [Sphingobium vermicomposti]NIJ16952.1 Flp pilus assembly protein TadG [Sphingobium vermicomposti]